MEFGQFGGWDTYRLDFTNRINPAVNQLCAVRGYYDGGYKVIFSVFNDLTVKLFVENQAWSLPPGYSKRVRITVSNQKHDIIYEKYMLLANDTSGPVKQFRFEAEPEFLGAVLAGFHLKIDKSEGGVIGFNIGDPDLNDAIGHMIRRCFPTLNWIGTPPTEHSLKVKPRGNSQNPF